MNFFLVNFLRSFPVLGSLVGTMNRSTSLIQTGYLFSKENLVVRSVSKGSSEGPQRSPTKETVEGFQIEYKIGTLVRKVV